MWPISPGSWLPSWRASAGDEILETYEAERAHSVRAMVNLSRRLGAVIMPTNRMIAAAPDAAFALLNLSAGFRSLSSRRHAAAAAYLTQRADGGPAGPGRGSDAAEAGGDGRGR